MQTANVEPKGDLEGRRARTVAGFSVDPSADLSAHGERLTVVMGGRSVDRSFADLDQEIQIGSFRSGAQSADAASDWLRTTTKRTLDIVGSLALAVIFAPILLPIALIMLLNGEAVLYKHRRVGRGGKTFECLKFRTMVADADKVLQDLLDTSPALKTEWLRTQKLRNDPRVTRIGRFLRRTSLDELPQIWNVLLGEMSLVGPRPITRQELMRYGRNTAIYLAVKPGVTGLWQVSGRSDTDYRRRVAMDVYYVRNWKFRLDLYILFKTISVVLGGGGAY
jgi:Undecaprenyl-phosphate galactose phosphotransferase WbaP